MNEKKDQKELKQIEDKLAVYLQTDRRNWAETYLLMKQYITQ